MHTLRGRTYCQFSISRQANSWCFNKRVSVAPHPSYKKRQEKGSSSRTSQWPLFPLTDCCSPWKSAGQTVCKHRKASRQIQCKNIDFVVISLSSQTTPSTFAKCPGLQGKVEVWKWEGSYGVAYSKLFFSFKFCGNPTVIEFFVN